MTSNTIVKEDLESIFNSNINWSRFAGKTILVSGANGFLPAYIVEALLYAQYKSRIELTIIAVVRNIQKAKKRFENYQDNKSLVFIEQNIIEPVRYDNVIDFVIHAASQASPKYYGVDPVGTLGANVLGTINLLDLSKEKNIESFLYFSSAEIYGQVDEEHVPTKEDYYGYIDPMRVRSCYGESKRMGENICISYFSQYNIPIKVVRPFHTYGPGMQLDDGRVYADFVSDMVSGRDIIMKSDGLARRAFCYLTDAVVGFFTVLLDGVSGEAYNVGNPEQEYSIIELAETLTAMGNLKVIRAVVVDDKKYLKSTTVRSIPNINKLLALGWKPKVNVTEGFQRTINSYLV